MAKRLAFVAVLLAAPMFLLAIERLETPGAEARVVTWRPATGPVDVAPVPDAVDPSQVQGLTVHEWGTFTSVAGPDGKAIEWLPAGGPTDLPCFVNLSGAGPKGLVAAAQGGRSNRATIRMETPVLYFYSPREQQVNVKVTFPRGLITEWFPNAAMGTSAPVQSTGIWKALESFPNTTTTIQWNNVRVVPGATQTYPIDERQSHYYAARRTGAMPLQVGNQFEKFLFYRGIASFTPPISARVTEDGKIEVDNPGPVVGERKMKRWLIPNIVLFENRAGKIGYRIHKDLSRPPGVQLELPVLDDTLESLQQDLEAMLRDQGMYPLEARAMVDTWKDSWFEQGTRIFYIVPPGLVDRLLPLEIDPKPVSVARAFVGRVEIFTPETLREVSQAVLKNDRATLETYGRFLEPILHNFLGDHSADGHINSIRADYLASATACSKKAW